MYYLFVTNMNTSKCVHKGKDDIYTPNMNIGCGPSLGYPPNIKKVRDTNVKCTGTGTGSSITGEVWCDYNTAKSLNLL